jgi:hypothetical protein
MTAQMKGQQDTIQRLAAELQAANESVAQLSSIKEANDRLAAELQSAREQNAAMQELSIIKVVCDAVIADIRVNFEKLNVELEQRVRERDEAVMQSNVRYAITINFDGLTRFVTVVTDARGCGTAGRGGKHRAQVPALRLQQRRRPLELGRVSTGCPEPEPDRFCHSSAPGDRCDCAVSS